LEIWIEIGDFPSRKNRLMVFEEEEKNSLFIQ